MRPVGLSVGSVARFFAAGRVAAGAVVLLRPEALARALRVDAGTARRTVWLARMFGIRDLALGAGTLFALARGGQPGPWLLASAASDAVDATALGGALRARQVGTVPAALAGGLAAVSVAVHLAPLAGRRDLADPGPDASGRSGQALVLRDRRPADGVTGTARRLRRTCPRGRVQSAGGWPTG